MRRAISIFNKDSYVVLAGPKGVGKTSIVETATQKTFGVATVPVPSGKSQDAILADVFAAVTRYSPRVLADQSSSARRVLWFHSWFFRRPATIILAATERKATQPFADLDSTAKLLAHSYGVRVIIDASDNSLPEHAKKTMREELIQVPPMSRDLIEELPQLLELHAALKAADLADVVWACLGGVPARYIQLNDKWAAAREKNPPASLEAIVEPFLQKLLLDAIENRSKAVGADKQLAELYALFREHNEVPGSVLEKMDLQRPSPDKVLGLISKREPSGACKPFLVSVDAPTAIVLHCALDEAPPLPLLKELLCKEDFL